MRVAMKNAKTVIDDQDRAKKAAVMGEVVASNKALDGALKQVKVLAPETPVIFFRQHWQNLLSRAGNNVREMMEAISMEYGGLEVAEKRETLGRKSANEGWRDEASCGDS